MVKIILDFDSTITKESTLIRLYMLTESFRDKQKREELENISNEFYVREKEILDKTYPKLFNCLKNNDFAAFLQCVTVILSDYEKQIIPYEIKGMRLVEPSLRGVTIKDLVRASSQVEIRKGFDAFLQLFKEKEIYIISCNWSDFFVQLVCNTKIMGNHILANRFVMRKGTVVGFDYENVILTPLAKFSCFKTLNTEKSIYCGDSFPDLMPTLKSDISFVFKSHDKNYWKFLEAVATQYEKDIYIVRNFNECKRIVETQFKKLILE